MKIELYKLILFLTLFQISLQDCNTGCLQCSLEGNCKFCDFTNNYFLENEICVVKDLPNCLITSVNGTCLQCDVGYYFETSTQKCKEVPLQIYTENCQYYSSNLSCLKCSSDFFIINNKCEQVQQKVANCIFYDSKDTCMECDKNYILSFDKKLCESFNDKNCLLTTSLKCTQCKSGYAKDINFYSNNLRYKAMNTSSIMTAMDVFLQTQAFSEETCQLPKVYNCKRYQSFFECEECNIGYYNLNGKCMKNPINKIANCSTYTTITVCQACIPGYYLETPTFCQRVEDIKHCIRYDTTSHYTQCLLCEDEYYLHINNSCVQREINFDECLKYSLTEDKCETCIEPSILDIHPNGQRCFQGRAHCKEYFNDDKIEIPECKFCKEGYYARDGNCIQGSIKFCKEYERTENQCKLCSLGYYLTSNRQCLGNIEILNCSVLNPFREAYCDKCESQYLLFQQMNQCEDIQIKNCKIAKNKFECFECQDFYNLNYNLQCEEGTILDCKIEKFNRCEKCQKGFVLHKEKCIEIESYQSMQCQIDNLNGLTQYDQYTCIQCNEYAESINLKNNFVCLSQNEFNEYVVHQPIQHCVMHYRNFEGIFQCKKCNEGFMSHENGTCVQACTTTIKNWQFGSQNSRLQVIGNEMCTINNDTSCKILTPLFIQDDTSLTIEYSCAECKTDYVKFIDYTNTKTLLSNEVINDWPVLKTSQQCIEVATNSITQVNDCELYAMFPDDNIRCVRCKFQYSDVIKAWKVEHCRKYDYTQRKCIECLPGYLLKKKVDNTLHYHICVAEYEIVPNCATLSYNNDQCYLCEDGYYLSDNGQTCTQFSITQCEVLSHNTQTCDRCNTNYQLKSDQTSCIQIPTHCVKVNDSGTCIQCKLGYNLNGTNCELSDCFMYNKDYTDCIYYKNKVYFTQTNTCVTAPYNLSNCIKYNKYRNCIQCTGHFYVNNGICSAVTTQVTNCKLYNTVNSSIKCIECLDNHTLQTRDNNQYCVPYQQYVENDSLETMLNFSFQDLNCQIFDLDKWKCQSCNNDTYNTQGICCADSKININGQCITLTQITQCKQLQVHEGKLTCLTCNDTFQVTKGICCSSDQLNYNGQCKDLSDFNCQVWDYKNNKCGTCTNDYYKVLSRQHCCNQGYYHSLTSCTEMPDSIPYKNCIEFDIDLNHCTKCNDDYFFNGIECLQTSNYTDHCVQYNNFVYQNLCTKCDTDHKLIDNVCCSYTEYLDTSTNTCTAYQSNQLISSCKVMGESTDCKECDEGNFLVSNNVCCKDYSQYTTSTCGKEWLVETNHCAYNAPLTTNCQYCLSSEDTTYYLYQGTVQKCCPEGQKLSSDLTTCEPISIGNCLQQNGTNCTKCKEGYLLNNNQCTQPITNCIQYNTTECIKCDDEYLLYKSTAQTTQFCLSKSNFNNSKFQNCLELDYVNSLCTQGSCDDTSGNLSTCQDCYTCKTCTEYSYSITDNNRKICVDYGYEFLSTSNTQIQQGIPHCASYQYSTTKETNQCISCYYDSLYKNLYSNEKLLIRPVFVNDRGLQHHDEFQLTSIKQSMEYVNTSTYLYNNNCVEYGKLLMVDEEVNIPIDHCVMVDSDDKCIQCEDEYVVHGEGKKCCDINSEYNMVLDKCIKMQINTCNDYIDDDNNKYYISNDHCCKEKTYWSIYLQKCVQNIDQNCLRSQDGIVCQSCDTNYYLQTEYEFEAVQESFNMSIENFKNFYQKIFLCLPSNKYTYAVSQITDFNNLVSQVKIKRNQNCKIYNTQTTPICQQCKDGYYQIQETDLCCAYNKVHIAYNDRYICGQIQHNSLNCLVYDYLQKKCQKCKSYFTNFNGYCCNQQSYFDQHTQACVAKVQNCKVYDTSLSHCIQCKDNYYITNQQCCQIGYYYNKPSSSCTQITILGVQNCQKFFNNKCIKCSIGYYLSKDKCCQEGFYNKQGECVNINQDIGDGTQDSGYIGCLQLDQYQKCISCQDSYLINGRCCNEGQYFNGTGSQCVQGNVDNCNQYDSFQKCISCDNNYYLSNDLCCGYGALNISNNCVYPKPSLTYLNIDHYNKHAEPVCESGYSLQKNNASNYECKVQVSTDTNCMKYTDQLPNTTCSVCSPGYIPNGTNDPQSADTCDAYTMTGCEIIQTYQSGPPNEICLRCSDGYLATYDNGQIDGCTIANFNCQHYITNTSNCELCNNNYYADVDDNYNCKTISSYNQSVGQNDPKFADECLIGKKQSTTLTCLRCKANYYLNGSTCTQITESNLVYNCLYYSSTQQCEVCNTDYYLSTNKCCHESISPSQCNNNDEVYRDIKNCDRFAMFDNDLVYCEKCKTGYYEVNDGCCNDNKLFNGFECVSVTTTGLDQCLQYENSFECKQISDQRTSNCMGGYYYTQDHCCALGEYWDVSQGQCVNIDQPNCTMIDEDGICIGCDNSKYISYGYCCDNGEYFNGKECVSLTSIANCEQYDNGKCTQCESGYDQQKGDNRCCSNDSEKYFWNEYRNVCTQVHTNCNTFDFINNTCTDCNYIPTSSYLSELTCCPNGQYYNPINEACESISNTSVDTSCNQLQPFNLNIKVCEGCQDNGTFQNSKCCQHNQLNLIDLEYCLNKDLLENCQVQNQNNSCSQCDQGYNLSEYQTGRYVCCEDGQMFDQTQQKCLEGVIEGCLQYKDSQNCLKCTSTRYLKDINNTYDKCIPNGYVDVNEFILEHCIEFNNIKQCTKCIDSYQLYISDNSRKCCPEGTYYHEDISTSCISTSLLLSNCSNFDFNKMRCQNCKPNFVLSKHICCPINQIAIDGVCTTPSTDLTCLSYDVNGNCLQCSDTHYVADGICCPVNTIINLTTRQCEAANDNCKVFTGYNYQTCQSCNSDSYMNSIGKCCLDNQYWDSNDSKCKTSDEQRVINCQGLEMVNDKLYCLQCKSNTYILAEDKTFCCQANEFLVDNECKSSTSVPDGCKKFNQENLTCTECKDNYYLYNGMCVQSGLYVDIMGVQHSISSLEIDIDDNCMGYDLELDQCIYCNEQYTLYHGHCIKIPINCKEYDLYYSTQCLECKDNYYLTNGQCCQQKKYFNREGSGLCEFFKADNLALKNCLEEDHDKCKLCTDNYYLNNGHCCQQGYYWDLTNEECKQNEDLKNCKYFGDSDLLCNECKSGYLLVKSKLGRSVCMQLPVIDNCQDYEIDVDNKYRCKECTVTDSTNFKISETANGDQVVTEYDYPVSLENCQYEDFKSKLVQSSFQCVLCNDNTTHYVFEGKCKERELTDNCADTAETYIVDKDRCTVCDEGYYVNDYNYCSAIPIDECLFYDKEVKLCMKCKAPTQLHYWQTDHNLLKSECVLIDQTEKEPPYFYPSYMETCTLESTCKDEKFVNLNGTLDKFFTCHKCTDENKIPFSSVQAGVDYTRQPYALQNFNLEQASDNKILNQKEGGKLSECLEPIDAIFNTDMSDFPSNCALGFINSEMLANTGDTNLNYQSLKTLSIFCVACKSGYKPRVNKTFPLQIEECESIQNCNSSIDDQFVNQCYECNENFIFNYNENGIDYTKCIDWTGKMPNCYAAFNNECSICQKGYYLNRDNICIRVQAHFCGEENFFQYEPKIESLHVRLYQNSKGTGCISCGVNQLGYFIERDHYICAKTNTMIDQKYKEDSKKYPNGCMIFGMVGNQFICKECYGPYLMSRDYTCISKSLLSSCKIAIDEQKCSECIDTHVAVNYKCVEKGIEHCSVYQLNPQLQNQICTDCVNGYYLNDNICLKGQVKDCLVYDREGRCTQCIDYHGIIILEGNEQRCVTNLKDKKCIEYDTKWLQEGYFVCTKCENEMQLFFQLSKPNSLCTSVPVIDNCLQYDIQKLFINSSLRCTECEKPFYTTGLECIQRQYIDGNCQEYNLTKDQCSKCQDSYYLDDNMQKCILIPEGVPGCYEYIDKDKCKICNTQLYLNNNQCVPIPMDQLIPHCEIYKNSKECIICEQFYFLVQNKCFKKKDPNCLEHLDQNICMKCTQNYVLTQQVKDNIEQVICIKPDDIEGCLQLSYTDQTKCEICDKQFYQVDGLCQAINKDDAVENCNLYELDATCKQCIDNYVLVQENGKQICKQNLITNGCQSFIKQQPFCVLCTTGYFVGEDGNCVKEDDSNNEGCMYYNRLTDTCTACYPGYIHNKQQQCVVVINPQPVELLSGKFLQIFTYVFLVLFLVN